MVQRASEGFKHGVTKTEIDMALYLQEHSVPYLSQEFFCLTCGCNAKSFGTTCFRCEHDMRNNITQCDFYLPVLNQVWFIDGEVHNKNKVAMKDGVKRTKLAKLGYKVVVYLNEEVKTLVGK